MARKLPPVRACRLGSRIFVILIVCLQIFQSTLGSRVQLSIGFLVCLLKHLAMPDDLVLNRGTTAHEFVQTLLLVLADTSAGTGVAVRPRDSWNGQRGLAYRSLVADFVMLKIWSFRLAISS